MRIEASTPGPVLSTPQSHKDYRADIDGLRAVAACSIVLFHAFPQALRGGFVGVDVFFVISGYLIGKIILSGVATNTLSFADFYARRIKRIFPALLIVLAACYAFGWVTLLPGDYKELGKHVASGAGFVSNFALWSEAGYFDAAAETKPLLHLWSLGIEEQFYIFWPLLLWLCGRFRINALIPIAAVCIASFALNVLTIHSHPTAAFYSPLSRIWELLIGTLLAYQHLNNRSILPSQSTAKSVLGALLIIAPIALLPQSVAFPGWWALLPTVGTYLMIDAGPQAWLNRRMLATKVFVWFGAISFPLYLWHWPLLSFARIVEHGKPSMATRGAAVVASVVLAWVTYRLVERPIRFGKNSRLKVASLCTLAMTAGGVGYISYALDGLAFRFPREVQRIADFKYDFKTDARVGKCWLSAEQPYDGFDQGCIPVPPNDGSKSVVVWGDSHAARLYPGIEASLGTRYAVSQLTRDSCPPIVNFGYAVCQKSNEHVIAEIRRLHPKTVVMFGVWGHYQKDWSAPSPERTGLLASIEQLKASGITDIVVLGPAPEWSDNLPKLVYQGWKDSYPVHKIPARLATGLDPVPAAVDKQLETLLSHDSVRYVSMMQFLCNKDGCLTQVPARTGDLLTWDYGHLTTEGAVFVSQHLSAIGVLP